MDEEKEHGIVIKFMSKGSAIFDMEILGDVTANQLLALSGFFEFQAKQMLADQHLAYRLYQENQKKRSEILKPGGAEKQGLWSPK